MWIVMVLAVESWAEFYCISWNRIIKLYMSERVAREDDPTRQF